MSEVRTQDLAAGSAPPVQVHESRDTLSLPFLIGAALIIGAGVIGLTEFMLTFNVLYLLSVLLFLLGGLMLFHPRSGPDSSD